MDPETKHRVQASPSIATKDPPAARKVLRHLSERPPNPHKRWEPEYLLWQQPWRRHPVPSKVIYGVSDPGRQDRENYRFHMRMLLQGKQLKAAERRWSTEDVQRCLEEQCIVEEQMAAAEAKATEMGDEGPVPGIYGCGNVGYDSEEELETWESH